LSKILVVDDQPQNIELLEAYLASQGYEIVQAANGEEALGKLSGDQIDLILLDVMMPGMDGFEVTRRVRQDDKHRLLPIILVTALHEKEDRVKGIDAGCDDFISKPVDKMELLARVRSLLKVKAYNDLMSNYQKELESEATRRTKELKHVLENLQQEINERKQAEEELTVSETSYRRLFESTKNGILILDAETGKIIDVNPFLVDLLAYSREKFIGKAIWEIGFFKVIVSSQDEFLELHQKEFVRYENLPLETVDGRLINVEFVSNIYLVNHQKVIQYNIRDITDHTKAEEALQESERKFRETVTNLDEGYYSVTLDGVLLEHNQAFSRILGFDKAADLKGTQLPDFWQNPHERNAYLQEVVAKGFISNYQIDSKTKTGEKGTLIASAHLVTDKDNLPLRIEGVFLDISDRKKAEEKIRIINENLEQRINERTAELRETIVQLEELNRAFVGRELKMMELKERIAKLERK